jgi:hypothetical protein
MPASALKLAAVAALAVGLPAVPGTAQEPRRPSGRYRVGALELTPRLVLKNAGVDTNVFHTLQDPVRDQVVVFGPRLDGALRVGRRLRATGTTWVDFNYFHREDDESSTDFYGGGDVSWTFPHFDLFGGGGGGQFTQRFSIDVDERLLRQEKRAHAGATWRITSRLGLTGQWTGEVVTFAPAAFRLGGSVKESLDRNTLIGAGQIRYDLTNRTRFVLSGEALEDRFFSQRGPNPRTRRSYRGLAGFEVAESTFRRTPSGKLLFGVRDFPETSGGSPTYRGPVAVVALAMPLGRLGLWRLDAERDVRFASSLVDLGSVRYRNAFVYERFQAEQQVALPLRVVGVWAGGFEQARYLFPYPYLSRSFLAHRVDHRWMGRVALARSFGRSMRLGGHVVWTRRVSSLPLFSYEGLTYGLTAEVTP